MPDVMGSIRARAAALQKAVGLPEVGDPRTIIAARRALDEGLARPVLVGPLDQMAAAASECSTSLDGIACIDPAEDSVRRRCAELFYQLRKDKGVTEDAAWEQVLDPLYCAACLLKLGDLDATVAGAANSTAAVLRPLLQIVKCAPGISTVSSSFIMETPQKHMGVDGVFLFADAGVMPNPTAEQLADIAITTAESARLYMETEPLVAMLSFSTAGSAEHPDVDKVRTATRLAQEKAPDVVIEGEMQVDAALVPEVALTKLPGSRIRGKANVLIFPDLDAGNIAYKIVQRLCNAGAYGPLVQGLARTGLDLSRGATPDDIYNVIAVAALRAEYCNNPV
ncbi:MAG: phosphate acetyltransferase [Armatimonadetes bacterium]|nr:phosphate acetyltransferase [Armatimonadota bacterium]